MTDTEESAFATMLRESVTEVERLLGNFVQEVLIVQIKRYRFTVMLGETHDNGQNFKRSANE